MVVYFFPTRNEPLSALATYRLSPAKLAVRAYVPGFRLRYS
jgi:hypothetical protein